MCAFPRQPPSFPEHPPFTLDSSRQIPETIRLTVRQVILEVLSGLAEHLRHALVLQHLSLLFSFMTTVAAPAGKPLSPFQGKSDEKMSDTKIAMGRTVAVGHVKKGWRFWLVFLAICTSLFLSAIEMTAVSTALPTIVSDLHGDDFVWIASAYSLAATALLPATGGMAEIFGRRFAMLVSLAMFASGSALCGSARSMNWMIAARTVQGAGGGGILSTTSIIISDLVSLRERAMYNALIGLTWAVASALGPVIGGSFTQSGNWRWLFYLNLPISAVAAVLIILFLNLKTPGGTLSSKLARMDWIGNVIIIVSTTLTVIALSTVGVRYEWNDARVLVPLIVGILGICGFLLYEACLATDPLVPMRLLSNRTSCSGYMQNFISALLLSTIIYFVPVYLQACKDATPFHSGIDILGIGCTIGPMLIFTGFTISKTKSYRLQLWLSWVLYLIAFVTISTLRAEDSVARTVGYTTIFGIASGIAFAATYFPVLAPLPVSENAHALAFFGFCRSFAGVWGSTVGSAILQTQLTQRLPADFTQLFPGGTSIAFGAIPLIPSLPQPLKTEIQNAFAESIQIIWQVMIGVACVGLIASTVMKAFPLHTDVDERWGMGDEEDVSILPM